MLCQRSCSKSNLSILFILGVGLALTASPALAQQEAYPSSPINNGIKYPRAISKIPPAVSPEFNEPDLVQPFTDPLTFNSDFQLFAPPDLSTYGGAAPPNTGWYFAYDRQYISINKPKQTELGGDPFAQPYGGKFLWGGRYDAGYMTKEGHGWNVTYSHVSTGLLIDDPELFIRLKPTYHSVELSKTFRKRLRYGGELEPYFGIRYIYFADNTNDDSPAGAIPIDDAPADREIFNQKMQNQMLGGQIGCRYHVRKGRWNLSSDVKIFAAQNYQYASVRDIDTALGVSEVNMAFSEFTPAGEIRCEAAYEITRDVSIRFGFGILQVARGILRADMAPAEVNPNNPNINPTNTLVLTNDQSLNLSGFMLGLEYNR